MSINDIDRKFVQITFANNQLILSGTGTLYWPAQQLIIVADLHLEKGSYYAQRGNPLPLYDTLDTLTRLEQVIAEFKPKKLLFLGDNMHDANAFIRMDKKAEKLLEQISHQIDEWLWLMGNHDNNIIPTFKTSIHVYSHLKIKNITFSHDFLSNIPHQIVGHYHPKLRFKTICGKCFLFNEDKIILPSFGSYTGGFDIDSLKFKQITQYEVFHAYLVNKGKIWRIK